MFFLHIQKHLDGFSECIHTTVRGSKNKKINIKHFNFFVLHALLLLCNSVFNSLS